MKTIGERIKKIRKEYKLTQEEFGSKIGVKGNTVTGYERGTRMPSDSVINMICLIFNVNQTWLRTGESNDNDDDIFLKTNLEKNTLDKLYFDYNCNALEISFLNSYFSLTEKERYGFCETLKKMFPALSELVGEDPLTPTWHSVGERSDTSQDLTVATSQQKTSTSSTELTLENIEKEVEDYRQQLLSEKEAAERSSASQGSA